MHYRAWRWQRNNFALTCHVLASRRVLLWGRTEKAMTKAEEAATSSSSIANTYDVAILSADHRRVPWQRAENAMQ